MPRLLSLYNNACFKPIHSHITLLCQGYYLCTTMHVSNQYILTLLSNAKVIIFVQQCMFQPNTFSHYSLMPSLLLSLYNSACFNPIHFLHFSLIPRLLSLYNSAWQPNTVSHYFNGKVVIFVQECMFQTNTLSHYSLMPRLLSLCNIASYKPMFSYCSLMPSLLSLYNSACYKPICFHNALK